MGFLDIFNDISDFVGKASDVYDKVAPVIDTVSDFVGGEGGDTLNNSGDSVKLPRETNYTDLISKGLDTAVDLGGYFLQDDAINEAQGVQNQAIDQATTLSERIYNQNRADIEPFRQTGLAANNRLSQLMGLGGIDEEAIRAGVKEKYADILTPQPQAFSEGEQNNTPAAVQQPDDRQQYINDGRSLVQGGWGDRENMTIGLNYADIMRMGDGYKNKYSGNTFNSDDYFEAVGRVQDYSHLPNAGATFAGGKEGEAQKWHDVINKAKHTSNYDPTGNYVDIMAPLVAGGILTGPAAFGLGGTAAIGAGMGANATGLTGASALMAGNQATMLSAVNSGIGYLK
jgi:hypothetical protein